MEDIMIGMLVEKEIKNKEAGGKLCEKCGFRYTNPSQYRRVKWCYVCLDEHNTTEVDKMLKRIGV